MRSYESGEDEFGQSARKRKMSQQNPFCNAELASRALSLRAREMSQSQNCFQEDIYY